MAQIRLSPAALVLSPRNNVQIDKKKDESDSPLVSLRWSFVSLLVIVGANFFCTCFMADKRAVRGAAVRIPQKRVRDKT